MKFRVRGLAQEFEIGGAIASSAFFSSGVEQNSFSTFEDAFWQSSACTGEEQARRRAPKGNRKVSFIVMTERLRHASLAAGGS